MWIREWKKSYDDVEVKDIWAIWQDIDHWTDWHDDLEYCRLLGEFRVGSAFLLKPKGAPEVKIQLTEINVNKDFTDCTQFFGAKMYDTHSLEQNGNGVTLRNKLVVTGPLKWLWVKLVAQNVANTVGDENDALVALARKR